MKDRFDLFLQPHSDHCLSDPVAHGGHTEDSRAAAMRFRYLHRAHRRREIGPRGHPIPDLKKVVLEILFERRQVHTINPCAPLFALTFSYACQTSHFEISNGFADDFSSLIQLLPRPDTALVDRTNTATAAPAPSLGSNYRSFVTTTSRSASAPRNGTHTRLNPWLLPVADETSSQRTDFATQCRDAPSHASC